MKCPVVYVTEFDEMNQMLKAELNYLSPDGVQLRSKVFNLD